MEGYVEFENINDSSLDKNKEELNDREEFLNVYGEFFDQVGEFEEDTSDPDNIYSGCYFHDNENYSKENSETTIKGVYFEDDETKDSYSNDKNENIGSYFGDESIDNNENSGSYFGDESNDNNENAGSYFGDESIDNNENAGSYFGDESIDNSENTVSYYGDDSNKNAYFGEPNESYFGEEKSDSYKTKLINSIAIGSPLSKSGKSINWNHEFQRILDMEDSEEKYTKLSSLANNFVFMAETYGKIIISELYLQNKSIKPVSIGGIAGGEKYIVQGILFKFAVDVQGIYGGDENAQKAAGHELKGLGHYWLSGVKGLNFPLMSIINYCGFCLIAMSVLPVNKSTLRYGSADGGYSVHKDDPVLNEKMEEAAKKMNLKGHLAGVNNPKLIYGPGDIEGHKGTDGKYYVLDFARTFPPEAVLPGDNVVERGRVLYKLLRPELVAKFRTPLSSDAFTGWGRADPDWKTHNEEVTEATRELFLSVIPNFVSNLTKEKVDNLVLEMNINGINLRHLGFIRSLLIRKNNPLATNVFIEILARTLKSILRKNWRDIVRNHLLINFISLKQCACDIINLLYSESEETSYFWRVEIKKVLLTKYRSCLSPAEADQSYDIREILSKDDKVSVCTRFCELCGIELTKRASYDLLHNTKIYLSAWDISTIYAKVKHMHITDFADMQALFYKGLNSKNSAEAERFFSLTLEKLQTSPHISLLASEKMFEFGILLRDNIHKWEEKECVVKLGETFFLTASRLNPSLSCESLLNIAMLYEKLDNTSADSKYEELIEQYPTPENYSMYLLYTLSKFLYKAPKILEQACELHPDNPQLNLIGCIYHIIISLFRKEIDLSKALSFLSKSISNDPDALEKYMSPKLLDLLRDKQFFLFFIISYEFPSTHSFFRKHIHKLRLIDLRLIKSINPQTFEQYDNLSINSIYYDRCNGASLNLLKNLIQKSSKSLEILKLKDPEEYFDSIVNTDLLVQCESLKLLSITNINDLILNVSGGLTGITVINFEIDVNYVKAICDKCENLETFKFEKSYYNSEFDEYLLKLKNLKSLQFKFSNLDDVKNVLSKYKSLNELNMFRSNELDNLEVSNFLLQYTPPEDSSLTSIISPDDHPFLYISGDFNGTILVPFQQSILSHKFKFEYEFKVNFNRSHLKDILSFRYGKRSMEFELWNTNIPVNSTNISYNGHKIGSIIPTGLNLKFSILDDSLIIFPHANSFNLDSFKSIITIMKNSNSYPFQFKGRSCLQKLFVKAVGIIIAWKRLN